MASERVDRSLGHKNQGLFQVDTDFHSIFVTIQMFELGDQK